MIWFNKLKAYYILRQAKICPLHLTSNTYDFYDDFNGDFYCAECRSVEIAHCDAQIAWAKETLRK